MNASNFAPNLNTIVLVIVAIAVVYTSWKTGAGPVNSQVMTNYETLDKQQKEQIAGKDVQIAQYQKDQAEIKQAMARMKEDHAKEMGNVQGQLEASRKQIADLQATVQNRNPELEKILGQIRDFMEQLTVKNDQQTTMLKEAVATNGNH